MLFLFMLIIMQSVLDHPSYGGIDEPQYYSVHDFANIIWVTVVDESDPDLLFNASSPLRATSELLQMYRYKLHSWVVVNKDKQVGDSIWQSTLLNGMPVNQVFNDMENMSAFQRSLEWLQDTYTTDYFLPRIPFSLGVFFTFTKSPLKYNNIPSIGYYCMKREGDNYKMDGGDGGKGPRQAVTVGGRLSDILSRYNLIAQCFGGIQT